MKRIHLIIICLLLCIGGYGQELQQFSKGGKGLKFGFRDAKSRKVVVPAKYDKVINLSNSLLFVNLDGKWWYLDNKGKKVSSLKYDNVRSFSDSLIFVSIDNKWWCLDTEGKEVSSLKYDDFDYIDKNLALVQLNGKWGAINGIGKEIIPIKYDRIELDYFKGERDYVFFVSISGKHGSIDNTGKVIVPVQYDSIARDSYRSYPKVMLNGKYGHIDNNGKVLVPVKYDYIGAWIPGIEGGIEKAEVWLDGKYGEIDMNGKEIAPLQYKDSRMQTVWENLLISNIKQINDFQSKIKQESGNSGNFTVERPCLLLSTYTGNRYNIDMIRYSENNFDEQSVKDLKTLVIRYNYPAYQRQYESHYTPRKTLTSHRSYLIYFDIAKKECIGYDILDAPDFPALINMGIDYRITVSNNDIIKQVESRLKTSE